MALGGLKGKVAVVTGSSRGWGRGVAVALAERGVRVVVNATTASTVAEVVREITSAGGEAVAAVADVDSTGGAHQVIGTAVDQFGRLDILVNSVGATRTGSLLDLTEDAWDDIVRLQLRSVFLCSKYAARVMVAQGNGGRIITVAGGAGQFGLAGNSGHAASKGAVLAATYSWAAELEQHAITVNAVRGAVISLGANRALRDLGMISGERSGLDDEAMSVAAVQIGYYPGSLAAPLVVWLASDEAASISGCNIGIDGSRVVAYGRTQPLMTSFNEPFWTAEDFLRLLQPLLEDNREPVGAFTQLWKADG
jgi:NAD(P)-dependent dehydrogenase (short-subunit alcohol dehydrogenase family)